MRFLFVDRIVQLIPGESVFGLKQVTADDYYLTGDEQGRLCFISSFIGETLGQLAAWNVMQYHDFSYRPVAGVVASAQVYRPVYVGETLLLESYIDSLDTTAVQYHSVAKVDEEVVFRLDGALGPLLPMQDFIAPELARRQLAEINRPGDWAAICHAQKNNKGENFSSMNGVHLPQFTYDQLVHDEPGIKLVANKRISRAAAYFADHFPHKPVLPLTVLLECKMNLAKTFIERANFKANYHVRELRRIKMSDFVYPGDMIETTVTIRSHDEQALVLMFSTHVADKRVCVLELLMHKKDNS